MQTRYIEGQIDLGRLSPASLTAASKALAALDALARAGEITWTNKARSPRKQRSDALPAGHIQSQAQAMIDGWPDDAVWRSTEEIAAYFGQHIPSTRIWLKSLSDAGYLNRAPAPRRPQDRGRDRLLYYGILNKKS